MALLLSNFLFLRFKFFLFFGARTELNLFGKQNTLWFGVLYSL
jgi:hypothetical protein